MLSMIAGGTHMPVDRIIASEDETEDAEAPFIQKLFGILRIYYTLLESIFFLVLKKPFIKKKEQLVEIISMACEVGMFATCLAILDREISTKTESVIGIFMFSLFVFGFLALISNEWYALYKQIQKRDTSKRSLLGGARATLIGLFLFFVLEKMMKNLAKWMPQERDNREISRQNSTGSGSQRNSRSRSSSTTDKPWLKQMAKASFRDGELEHWK